MVMVVVTAVLDYRNPELGYVIWNRILPVYMMLIFVVMMVAEQGRATGLVVCERVEQGELGWQWGVGERVVGRRARKGDCWRCV